MAADLAVAVVVGNLFLKVVLVRRLSGADARRECSRLLAAVVAGKSSSSRVTESRWRAWRRPQARRRAAMGDGAGEFTAELRKDERYCGVRSVTRVREGS